MATKFTVAVIGSAVIFVSAVILIYESLSSPIQCALTGESVDEISPTERNKVRKSETASSITSITTSTPLSSGFAFPPSSTILPTSGVAFHMDSTAHLRSRVTFRTDSTFRPSSGLTSSTNSIIHSPSSVTTKSNSATHYSSELTSSSTLGVNSSSGLTSTTSSSSLVISPSAMYSPSGTISLLSTTSTAQSSSAVGAGPVSSRDEDISSTLGPNAVLSSAKDPEEKVTSQVTLSSVPEEETEDIFESDLQTRAGGTDVVTESGKSSSSIHSRETLPRNGHRNIITTPKRNCGNGEKRDMFGKCRPVW
jgi:hypothetical protein